MTSDFRVISADDVCTAAETVLRTGLPVLVGLLELDDAAFPVITEWQQLPTTEALTSANLPAAAVSSPGLTGTPRRNGDGSWDTVWRVDVGIFARGADHSETQERVRTWCALIRTVLLANPSLGGLGQTLSWAGERYALFPQRNTARTFGGGAVSVDVAVDNVADLGLSRGPVVLSTHPSLTIQPAGQVGQT